MRRLLIISCGATKRGDPGLLPAIERYNGSPFKTLRATLRAMDSPTYRCSPSGVKAQRVHTWDEAPRFSGFSFMAF